MRLSAERFKILRSIVGLDIIAASAARWGRRMARALAAALKAFQTSGRFATPTPGQPLITVVSPGENDISQPPGGVVCSEEEGRLSRLRRPHDADSAWSPYERTARYIWNGQPIPIDSVLWELKLRSRTAMRISPQHSSAVFAQSL